MATTIDDLLVRIDATTEGLRRELRRADRQVVNTERRMTFSLGRINGAFNRLGRALGPLGFGLSVGALGVAARQAVRDLDQLNDAAEALGITAEQLQELRFAGEEAGLATNTVDMAMQRFIRRLGEAQRGGGELKGTLDEFGIAIRDANGEARDADDVLRDLADAIAGVGDEQTQLAIAFKAFDSEGARFVSVLRDGSTGLDEMSESARRLGVILSNETVAAAAEIDRQFEILSLRLSTTFKSAVVGVVDFFSGSLPRSAEEAGAALERLSGQILELEILLEEGGLSSAARQGIEANIERLQMQADAMREVITDFNNAISVSPGSTYDPNAETRAKARAEIALEIEQLDRQIAALQESEEAYLNVTDAIAAENRVRATGLDLADEENAVLLDLAERREEMARVVQTLTDEMREAEKGTVDLTRDVESFGGRASGAFARAAIAGGDFGRVLDSLLSSFISAGFARAGEQFFGNLVGGLTNRGPSEPYIASQAVRMTYPGVPGRSTGGPVSAGQVYQTHGLGRREYFVPNVGGRIETGGGGMVVQVINNSGSPAEIEQGSTVDGRKTMRIVVGREAAADVRQGGPLASAIGDAFGLDRRGVRRGV